MSTYDFQSMLGNVLRRAVEDERARNARAQFRDARRPAVGGARRRECGPAWRSRASATADDRVHRHGVDCRRYYQAAPQRQHRPVHGDVRRDRHDVPRQADRPGVRRQQRAQPLRQPPRSRVGAADPAWSREGDGRGATNGRRSKNVEASRYTLQQANADQVLATAEAYVGLLAAQESLNLTRESLETQRRLLEATIKLVAAGEVPAADVARARARLAEVEASVESARGGVLAAQALLADVMGTPATDVSMLAAADALPVMLRSRSISMRCRRGPCPAGPTSRRARRTATPAGSSPRPRRPTRARGSTSASAAASPRTTSGRSSTRCPTSVPRRCRPIRTFRYYSPTGLGRAFGRHWGPDCRRHRRVRTAVRQQPAARQPGPVRRRAQPERDPAGRCHADDPEPRAAVRRGRAPGAPRVAAAPGVGDRLRGDVGCDAAAARRRAR